MDFPFSWHNLALIARMYGCSVFVKDPAGCVAISTNSRWLGADLHASIHAFIRASYFFGFILSAQRNRPESIFFSDFSRVFIWISRIQV